MAEGKQAERVKSSDPTINKLFDEAYKINEEMEGLLERRKAVRDSLRNLAKTSAMGADEKQQVKDLYEPKRPRKDKDASKNGGAAKQTATAGK